MDDLASALTLAPPAIGVAIAVWRTQPGWALAGLILAVPGLLNPDGNSEDLIYAANGAGVPADTTRKMLDQLAALPAFGPVGSYAVTVAFALGGSVLGIGIIRSDSAPRWAGSALVIADSSALLARSSIWDRLCSVGCGRWCLSRSPAAPPARHGHNVPSRHTPAPTPQHLPCVRWPCPHSTSAGSAFRAIGVPFERGVSGD